MSEYLNEYKPCVLSKAYILSSSTEISVRFNALLAILRSSALTAD